MNGALANLPNNRNEPFSYNLIGQRTNVVPTFSSGRKFQDYIGTSALPTFKYVESIITHIILIKVALLKAEHL